jgi:hypothetical protein
MALTHEQLTQAVEVVAAIGTAIRDLKQVPSGELYAHVMHRLSLADYNNVISTLKNAGLIRVSNHLITWTGK